MKNMITHFNSIFSIPKIIIILSIVICSCTKDSVDDTTSAELTSLTSQLNDIQGRLDTLQKDYDALTAENLKQSETLGVQTAKVTSLELENERQKKVLDDTNKEIEELQSTKENQEKVLNEQKSKVADLEKKNENLATNIKKFENKNQELDSELKSVRSDLADANAKVSDLEKTNTDLNKQLEDLKTKLAEAEGKATDLEERLASPNSPITREIPSDTPTRSAASVIGIFSDAYDTQSSVNDLKVRQLSEDDQVIKLDSCDPAKITLGTSTNSLDASDFTHLHLHYWVVGATSLKLTLTSSSGDDTSEASYDNLSVDNKYRWNSVEIPLSSFGGIELENLTGLQLDIDNSDDCEVYFDEVYLFLDEN